ncbi:MAG: hypothetical protein IM638_06760 [Bacteroidetes bacterium]|nr:hypothetical protein [Bacteroidota bacterium]
MSEKLIIDSGPTFRMGVPGTVMIFIFLLLGLVVHTMFLLAIIPSVSLVLGWRVVAYSKTAQEISFTNYTLLIPFSRTFPVNRYTSVFLEYQWKPDWRNQKTIRRFLEGNDDEAYSRYFDLQLRGADNKKLNLANFTDYSKAAEKAKLLARTLNIPFTDDYYLRKQSVQKRREEYEKRRKRK